MQLGRRWRLGEQPPTELPAVVATAVRGVEDELAASSTATAGWGWTLTYLERLPVVDLDDGTRIRYLPDQDRAVVHAAEFEDDPES